MINYAYPTLFTTEGTQKDLLITDGTITVSGTTYTVSGETVKFTNSDIEEQAFELSQSLCSEMQLTFGCCETAKMTFTVRNSYNSSIIGTVVKLYIIPNHDASKMLQLGVFKIYEDQESNDHQRHTITAYDAMYEILNADVSDWYNTILPDENTNVTIAAFRASFLSEFNITAESTTLINDTETITRTLNPLTKQGQNLPLSGAKIIKAICELNAVFGVITNEGKFRFVSLVSDISSSLSTTTLPVAQCIDVQDGVDCNNIYKVEIYTQKVKWVKAVGGLHVSNTYVIAYNPLITDGEDFIDNLFDEISGFTGAHAYTSCTINALGNPLHEVGDPIEVQKKDGTSFYTYILQRTLSGVQALRDTYVANGVEILSYNLNDQSYQLNQIENTTASGGGSGGGSALGVSTYTNGRAITVGTSRTKIGQLTFGVSENTTALVACTMLAEVSGVTDTATLTVWLRINRSWEEYFIPQQIVVNGSHIITINIPLSVAPLDANIIDFYVTMSEGEAYFDVQKIWASVSAAGLETSPEWNGEIEMEETFEPFNVGVSIVPLTETVSVADDTPTPATVTQTITPLTIGISIVGFNENVGVGLE